MRLTESPHGGIFVTVVEDPILFRDTFTPHLGIRCTSAVQTYLDLSIAGERAEEAAAYLRRNVLNAKRILSEGQVASDYDDRITVAVKSVLIEIGQVLGSFKGKFAVVGGAVPWLLLNEHDDMPHVGTLDVDLGLDAEALGDGEYAGLVQALLNNGYRQQDTLRRFQLVRQVRSEECAQSIDVVVDFLMPREVTLVKNSPPLLSDFAVQKQMARNLLYVSINLLQSLDLCLMVFTTEWKSQCALFQHYSP